MVQGKRYFKCQPNHGLFVPIRVNMTYVRTQFTMKDAMALLNKKVPNDVVAVANRLSSIRALRSSFQKLPSISPVATQQQTLTTTLDHTRARLMEPVDAAGRYSPNYSDITEVLTRRTVVNSPFESTSGIDFNKQ